MAAPSEFPPPVDSAGEFIGPATDPEDERIQVGVAIVLVMQSPPPQVPDQ